MRYQVRRSFVDVIGRIWMPSAVCSMRYDLREYDIENMRQEAIFRNGSPELTRDVVEYWVNLNSGDFQSILDFRASIEDGDTTVEFEFETEEGENAYYDTIAETEEV